MIEAMDDEIGRVLVETGTATRGSAGELEHGSVALAHDDRDHGDNGTYAPGAKAPFNPERAKATVYQTGVWTPLIVAGPLVDAPGRQVGSMVNIADVFGLFGDMAGIDVHTATPPSRPIDSVSMLPYLGTAHQGSLRRTNFTQPPATSRLQATWFRRASLPASVLRAAFPTQPLCASEGGIWWGATDTTLIHRWPLPSANRSRIAAA